MLLQSKKLGKNLKAYSRSIYQYLWVMPMKVEKQMKKELQ